MAPFTGIRFRCLACRTPNYKKFDDKGNGIAVEIPLSHGRVARPFCCDACVDAWKLWPTHEKARSLFGNTVRGSKEPLALRALELYERAEAGDIQPQRRRSHSIETRTLKKCEGCTEKDTSGVRLVKYAGQKMFTLTWETI